MEEILLEILAEFKKLNEKVSDLESQLQEIKDNKLLVSPADIRECLYGVSSDIVDKLDELKEGIKYVRGEGCFNSLSDIWDKLRDLNEETILVKDEVKRIKGETGYDLTYIYNSLSDIERNTSKIEINTSKIETNTSKIETNISSIETNTTSIDMNTSGL